MNAMQTLYNTIHLRMTQDQARARYRSTGNFEGPLPLCGNGSFHCRTDSRKGWVNCPACLAKMGVK